MIINKLTLTNFRNYSNLDLNFSSNTTLIIGNNASGKTNILEAIYYLATTKSFRAELDREVVRWGATVAHIEGEITTIESDKKMLKVVIAQKENLLTTKQLSINGVPRRAVDYFGSLAVLLFSPTDVELVTSSPSSRRHQLDLFLAQIDRDYKRAITLFSQILIQRNRLLIRIREGEARINELEYWDRSLLSQATIISDKREELFSFLNTQPKMLGQIEVSYYPRRLNSSELSRVQVRDIAAGQTTVGPHRDDYVFFQDAKDLAHFGSRGQQRTAILAFKLWELQFMSQVLKEPPILLLDDIFSELDHAHRDHIMRILPHQQTIIISTDPHLVDSRYLVNLDLLRVSDGKVSRS